MRSESRLYPGHPATVAEPALQKQINGLKEKAEFKKEIEADVHKLTREKEHLEKVTAGLAKARDAMTKLRKEAKSLLNEKEKVQQEMLVAITTCGDGNVYDDILVTY